MLAYECYFGDFHFQHSLARQTKSGMLYSLRSIHIKRIPCLQSIKDRGALICRDDNGTSSYSLQSGAAMSQALPAQIRELANRTGGVQLQYKTNSKGGGQILARIL
jgi:hypothetical protein